MSRPIIEVRSLSKSYRLGHIGFTSLRSELERWWARRRGYHSDQKQSEFWALRDISFDVAPGEVIGIIGRNGAGKSTLLKILSEITEPTSGEIRLRGHVASLLEVGTGFHPELSGRENIYLNGATLGMKRAEIRRKFDEIVAFAEVDKFLDTPVKRYSSGMYVRLAFAVAAHLEPEILLVDEVLAVGDHAFQQKCLGKMQDVANNDGRTILFVSHNMAAVSRLCRRAIHLDRGRIATAGNTEDVLKRYLTAAVTTRHEWRRDSEARGRVALTAARVLDEAGCPAAVLRYDSCVTVEIECEEQATVAPWALRVSIYDRQGVELLAALDTEDGLKRGSAPGRVWRRRCAWPAALLRPGNYQVTASVYELAGDQPVATYDEIEAVVAFEISPQGFTNLTGSGVMGVKPNWTTQ